MLEFPGMVSALAGAVAAEPDVAHALSRVPSWISALVGAIAAGLVVWGAFREKLNRHDKEIDELKKKQEADVLAFRKSNHEIRDQLQSAKLQITRLEAFQERDTP